MRVERPWGWYESLTQGDNYLVKRLLVRAGQQLSLQRHRHRSESWTVVSGSGALLCEDTWHAASAGVMLSIPCGACLLYTSPSPRDRQKSRMPSSA